MNDASANPDKNLLGYNQQAWNRQVAKGSQWTQPVASAQVAAARQGDLQIVLTPEKPIPPSWFPDFSGGDVEVLCLAGSGGQQAPLLAAAGANVTVWDFSESQLAQDQMVAERESLSLTTIQGDMRDLHALADESFDLIVHPCSNSFVPDVNPVWREAARVLKRGGHLLAGFINPVFFLFDDEQMQQGKLVAVNRIPFSDLESLPESAKQKLIEQDEPFCFGHTLSDQIGGQLAAGLGVIDFYEDTWPDYLISNYIACFCATRSVKL